MERTADIKIDKAFLQLEEVRSEIASLSMDGNDINLVRIVHELKEFIINAKREICPLELLRQTPVVAVVKVIAMRLGQEERWHLAQFGTLAIREHY